MTGISLNEQQAKAVAHTQGPLMILAGAGAGKTRVITERIIHLIHSGVAPESILAVTFTNKAAKEMRERVRVAIDNDERLNRPVNARATGMALPYIATFHSLGVSLLREHANELNIKKHFTIYDRTDSMRAVKHAIKHLGLDPKQFDPRATLSAISRYKSDALTPLDFAPDISDTYRHTVHRIWQEYEVRLHKEGALDFDDLLVRTFALLRDNEAVREKLQRRWTHIHIDEYQDTNRVQFAITKLLTGKEGNICVVGDIDQCVYSWRGANLANLLSFEEEFPGTTLIVLEQNYRSTQTILTAANNVIKKNKKRKEKNLFTTNDAGELIAVYGAYNEDDEARFVVAKAQELIEGGVAPRDIAVLYRANFQSRVLEQAAMYANLPYQVLGTRFFDRAEVKDVLSYIRAALNRDSAGDISRIVATPPRGIGKMTLAKMLEGNVSDLTPAAQKKVADFYTLLDACREALLHKKPSEAVLSVATQSGIKDALMRDKHGEAEERWLNIRELAALAAKYDELPPEEGILRLIEDASLATDQDSLEKDHNAVKFMTVHASKGLEFKHVFIVGLEEGLFPYQSNSDEARDEEEERRLFYVAVTRAEKTLTLTYAAIRSLYGAQSIQTPSQFIEDIGTELIEPVAEAPTPHDRGVDLIDF